MLRRGKWGEVSWSRYWFLHVYLVQPSNGWDKSRVKFSLGIGKFFLSLNLWKTKPHTSFEGDPWKVGLAYFGDAIWIYHGAKYTHLSMPWEWTNVRCDLLRPDGSLYIRNSSKDVPVIGRRSYVGWYDVFGDRRKSDAEKDSLRDVVTLTHITKEGNIQVANITLAGEEREWRWKWFTWLPIIRKVKRTVGCNSDAELGEKAGSWKGGLMGWSCEWREGETMEQAFRRWYSDWNGV